MSTSSSMDAARIEELEGRIAELTESTAAKSSRRNMLKLAGAAAGAAAAVAVVGNASPAAATTGQPLLLGQYSNPNPGDVTGTIGTFQALADSASATNGVSGYKGVIVGWDTTTSATEVRAGVVGLANPFLFTGTNQSGNGLLGVANGAGSTGAGVYGISNSGVVATSSGGRARSVNGPAIQMEATLAGAPTTGTWTLGALFPDTAGNLWYCTVSGTPGTWVNLVPQPIVFPTNGNFTAIVPSRVYDSRAPQPSSGALGAGGTRTLSVKDSRALDTGALVTADIVPNGAKAITANVTVVNTTSAGFLAVNPGGNTTVSAATVNWFASGQILNNGVNVTINPATRQVTVIAGGNAGASTDFVIDVTGYFL